MIAQANRAETQALTEPVSLEDQVAQLRTDLTTAKVDVKAAQEKVRGIETRLQSVEAEIRERSAAVTAKPIPPVQKRIVDPAPTPAAPPAEKLIPDVAPVTTPNRLKELSNVDAATVQWLYSAGYRTTKQVSQISPDLLPQIPGFKAEYERHVKKIAALAK